MRETRVLLCAFVSCFFLGVPVAALAHPSENYFGFRWRNTELVQNYRFTQGFPDSGGWRARAHDAAASWNGVNTPMLWSPGSTESPNFTPPGAALGQCPAAGNNTLHHLFHDGPQGTYAYVAPCIYSGTNRLASVTMVVDSTEDWYSGTGDAPDGFQVGGECINGPCQVDLWSILTHEFGHMSGFTSGPNNDGHFPRDYAICQAGNADQTMCAEYTRGHERARTLEDHDKHTFSAAY